MLKNIAHDKSDFEKYGVKPFNKSWVINSVRDIVEIRKFPCLARYKSLVIIMETVCLDK